MLHHQKPIACAGHVAVDGVVKRKSVVGGEKKAGGRVGGGVKEKKTGGKRAGVLKGIENSLEALARCIDAVSREGGETRERVEELMRGRVSKGGDEGGNEVGGEEAVMRTSRIIYA